eukprot:555649-Pelagomonas_calceolata.AAC.1
MSGPASTPSTTRIWWVLQALCCLLLVIVSSSAFWDALSITVVSISVSAHFTHLPAQIGHNSHLVLPGGELCHTQNSHT